MKPTLDTIEQIHNDHEWDLGNHYDGPGSEAEQSMLDAVAQMPSLPSSLPLAGGESTSKSAAPQTVAALAPSPAGQSQTVTGNDDARRHPLRSRLSKDARVISALTAAKNAKAEYVRKLQDFAPVLHPENRIEALRRTIGSTTDAAEMLRAQAELSGLTHESAALAQQRARHLCHVAATPFVEGVEKLLDAAELALKDLEIEAEVAETALFSGFDLQREETGVSRRLHRIKKDLVGYRESARGWFTAQVPIAPTGQLLQHVLAFFGSE